MSMVGPRMLVLMAEHSMCQPGLPRDQGLSHQGSPSLLRFHRAKSRGSRLSSPMSTRAPASISSVRLPLRLP